MYFMKEPLYDSQLGVSAIFNKLKRSFINHIKIEIDNLGGNELTT